jgi:hypothetical protein
MSQMQMFGQVPMDGSNLNLNSTPTTGTTNPFGDFGGMNMGFYQGQPGFNMNNNEQGNSNNQNI